MITGGDAPAPPVEPVDIDSLLDHAVAGVPRARRGRTRRELAGYMEDAFADLLAEGRNAAEAADLLRRQFGDPATVATGLRRLPPPFWARGVQRSAAPLSVVMLGLVLGLALVQMQTARLTGARSAIEQGVLLDATPAPTLLAQMNVRQVDGLQVSDVSSTMVAAEPIRVSSRLGAPRPGPVVLEPSVPAMSPGWLPDGYDPGRGALQLHSSSTIQYFDHSGTDQAGIVVEVLRPDRATVFQVKERHIFPVRVGDQPGFYIDGEWEIRGPIGEQPSPATWRTDRSHSLLFQNGGYLILVAGPADVLDEKTLLRIARSVR